MLVRAVRWPVHRSSGLDTVRNHVRYERRLQQSTTSRVGLKLQSLPVLMLDWTTSFLSDVFIIGLTLRAVKLFLQCHNM
jgi:hypothetical protein